MYPKDEYEPSATHAGHRSGCNECFHRGGEPTTYSTRSYRFDLNIIITKLHMQGFNEPNSVKAKSIAPRRPMISESRPTYQELALARIYAVDGKYAHRIMA